jgi:hypothetical protein
MIVSLIISSPKNVKVANFDVYLEPVIKELEQLWKGVAGLDVLQPPRSSNICVESHVNVHF